MIFLIFKRFLAMIPVGLGVTICVGMMVHMVPGDPAALMLGEFATEAEKNDLRKTMGLDRPLWEQIVQYIGSVSRGDLGISFVHQRPTWELILERLWPTVELAFCAMAMAMMLGFSLGILAALKKNSLFDHLAMGVSLLGMAMPTFWVGPLLIWLLSLYLDLFPVSERGDWSSYVLPSLTLGIPLGAVLARVIRASLLDQLKEDYVRTARAKGLDMFSVVKKHAWSNSLLPVLTILGLQLGTLLTGAIITEKIFDWPGLGSLMIEGLSARDYPLVQGCILFFSGVHLTINLITDLLYAWADPRIHL